MNQRTEVKLKKIKKQKDDLKLKIAKLQIELEELEETENNLLKEILVTKFHETKISLEDFLDVFKKRKNEINNINQNIVKGIENYD